MSCSEVPSEPPTGVTYGADPAYASTLLQHATQLFDFGYRCQGNYVNDGRITAAEPFY